MFLKLINAQELYLSIAIVILPNCLLPGFGTQPSPGTPYAYLLSIMFAREGVAQLFLRGQARGLIETKCCGHLGAAAETAALQPVAVELRAYRPTTVETNCSLER